VCGVYDGCQSVFRYLSAKDAAAAKGEPKLGESNEPDESEPSLETLLDAYDAALDDWQSDTSSSPTATNALEFGAFHGSFFEVADL
jgi:hypothetical protein